MLVQHLKMYFYQRFEFKFMFEFVKNTNTFVLFVTNYFRFKIKINQNAFTDIWLPYNASYRPNSPQLPPLTVRNKSGFFDTY